MRIRSLLLAALLSSGVWPLVAAEPTPEQTQFFESKIRPIFAQKCYKCHNGAEGKSKGGLTLDTREGVLKGGDTGPAVVPGDEKSLLIAAVKYLDPDMQMPPKGEKLSDPEIADLVAWVKMGAPDPRKASESAKLSGLTDKARKHWAFQPIAKPTVPTVKNRAWCVTPVDAFVLEKLEEKSMVPSPDADREQLLRRASYDLTGLPPSPAEIDAFVHDPLTTTQALAKVVDRLLASPAYGERWGRFWLDSARYSDTTGGERDAQREDYRFPYAWTYRDWVVKAFNSDMPYDQFITHQLAADKLPNNQVNLAALGFITVGERFENANDVINDRIDTVSKGFLGLTVACARCHDHMFDPISIKDYYALHGVFSSIVEPTEKPLIVDTADKKASAEFAAQIASLEDQNRAIFYKVSGDYAAMFREKAAAYLAAQNLRRMVDVTESLLAADKIIETEKLNVDVIGMVGGQIRNEHRIFGPLARIRDNFSGHKAVHAEAAANKDNKLNPLVAKAFKDSEKAGFTKLEDYFALYGKIFSEVNGQAGSVYNAYAQATDPAVKMSIDADVAELVVTPFRMYAAHELTTEGVRMAIRNWPNGVQGRANFTFGKINNLMMTHAGSGARAMVVSDASMPTNSSVFIRGQANVKGDVVPRRFLEVLSNGRPQPFRLGSGRLELAQAIANKRNPLTARVIVNRVWMRHFGQGFVRTLDDIGTQSEAPSHEQLVDYLSWYLMEQGWSLKKLHKVIMLSRVYMQRSRPMEEYNKIDPDNRLLWRANIRRLDFEAIRDSMLVFSGRLDKTMGGPPVNLTDEPFSFRRSVYGYVDRGNLPEVMQAFDFSNPEQPNSTRTTTIVPQQALFMMNGPMAVDVARRVVQRPEVSGQNSDLRRINGIYRILFQRTPRPEETMMAVEFLREEGKKHAEAIASMKDVSSKAQQNAEKRAEERLKNSMENASAIQNSGTVVERKPLTPWETYAQALLFSNEAVYVQ